MFDEVTIPSDVVFHSGTIGTDTFNLILFCNSSGEFGQRMSIAGCTAGTTNPGSGYYLWYDTTNNKVRFSQNADGNFDSGGYSLPVGIYQRTNGVATSINQVFNGFGYIGSTTFALPGVKGLIPNGRNEDGSLKNIEFTLNKVVTGWVVANQNNIMLGLNSSMIGSGGYYYDYVNNFVRNSFDNNTTRELCIVTSFSSDNSKITSFNPKTTFQAVNYNDKSDISRWGMPSVNYIDLTLGASGASYTAPANGWFSCSSEGVVNIMLSNQEFSLTIIGASGYAPFGFMPVKKGELFVFCYSSNQNNKVRFYYAEGEQ